jgi:hypothetical protein
VPSNGGPEVLLSLKCAVRVQVTCGAELALLLVEVLVKTETPFGEEPLGKN